MSYFTRVYNFIIFFKTVKLNTLKVRHFHEDENRENREIRGKTLRQVFIYWHLKG